MNILTFVDSFNWGAVAFDPSLPVDDANARINTTAVAFTRTLAIAGRSANIGLQVPVVAGHLEGVYAGVPTELDRFGLGDPRVSVGVNLYGAPAMTPMAFGSYRMHTLVGVNSEYLHRYPRQHHPRQPVHRCLPRRPGRTSGSPPTG